MFAKHVHFARASLRFRREFGGGIKQGLTLGERLQWAASTTTGKISLAILLLVFYDNPAARYVRVFSNSLLMTLCGLFVVVCV